MNKYTYDFEVQTMVTMFINAMSDIVIKRFNVNRQARDQIKTRIVYAPKQRVLNDLLDRDQNLVLPVIACTIGGLNRDPNRVYNKILGTYHDLKDKTINEKTPLPVDLTINISIMTRYQADMDQILTHIMPYINPYFVVSWRTPLRPDFEIRSKVEWNGSANVTYPIDLNATQVAKVVADLSFVFKGWIFQSYSSEDVGTVYTIHTNFNEDIPSMPVEFLLPDEIRNSTEQKDYWVINGSEPAPSIIDPYLAVTQKPQAFRVVGSGFTSLSNVYLSGVPFSSESSVWNPFSEIPSLSAQYPPFTGVKLLSSDWSYDKDHMVTFIMPSAATAGFVDVIIEGPAGYGLLTQHVRRSTLNPFPEGTVQHETYIPYQPPYLSGIEVVSWNTIPITPQPSIPLTPQPSIPLTPQPSIPLTPQPSIATII
jgi:hypothetical protein